MLAAALIIVGLLALIVAAVVARNRIVAKRNAVVLDEHANHKFIG